MNLYISESTNQTILEERFLDKKIGTYKYFKFSSTIAKGLTTRKNKLELSTLFTDNEKFNSELLINLLKNLGRESFYTINSESDRCLLRVDLDKPELKKKTTLSYLNLESVNIYVITNNKNEILNNLSIPSQKNVKSSYPTILGFFEKKMAIKYMDTCKLLNLSLRNLGMKVVPISLSVFYNNWHNNYLNFLLIPGKMGYGEKIYIAEKDLFNIKDKAIFLASFSKEKIKKTLNDYANIYKEKVIPIKELKTNDFFKETEMSLNQYFFIGSPSDPLFQNQLFFQERSKVFSQLYFRLKKIYQLTPFFQLEQATNVKNDFLLKFLKTFSLSDSSNLWLKNYKERLLRRNKKAKNTSFIRGYLKLAKKQRRFNSDNYSFKYPKDLRKQSSSTLNFGKSRIKILNNTSTNLDWINLSSLSKKFLRKKYKGLKLLSLKQESTKTFLKYFQVNKSDYLLNRDFQTFYLITSPSSKWWKYHKFFSYTTKKKEIRKKNLIRWDNKELTKFSNHDLKLPEKKWLTKVNVKKK